MATSAPNDGVCLRAATIGRLTSTCPAPVGEAGRKIGRLVRHNALLGQSQIGLISIQRMRSLQANP
jgi:hypothetical protein